MKTRALDINYDWRFGRGLADYKSELNALKQKIRTRILSWKGNCFFSTNDYVDWNSYLGIGTKDFLDLNIIKVLLQTQGVVKIDSYTSTLTDRTLTVTCYIISVYGNFNLTI